MWTSYKLKDEWNQMDMATFESRNVLITSTLGTFFVDRKDAANALKFARNHGTIIERVVFPN